MSARVLAGRVRKPAAKPAAAETRDASDKPRKPRLPQKRGWLAAIGPDIAVYGSQLRYLLCSPDMRALMQDAPQLARLLRPLCRMLAIEPGADLPPNLYPVRPKKSRPPRAEPRAPVAPARPARPARKRRVPADPANWWMPKRA